MKKSNLLVVPIQSSGGKNIKNITRQSKQEFILNNPQSDTPLNSKDIANLMNEYFTSLTSIITRKYMIAGLMLEWKNNYRTSPRR